MAMEPAPWPYDGRDSDGSSHFKSNQYHLSRNQLHPEGELGREAIRQDGRADRAGLRKLNVEAVTPIIQTLGQAGCPLYRDSKDTWYQAENIEVGQREFIVQDPEGYLVKLVERLGERPACQI